MGYSKLDVENILKEKIKNELVKDTGVDEKVNMLMDCLKTNRLLVNKLLDKSFTECNRMRSSELIHGVGIVDVDIKPEHKAAYETWRYMLRRSYSVELKTRKPSYEKCTVANDWLVFSEFLKFYSEHYVDGYHLDKDILVKGNKVYSKETCCFVPVAINGIIVNVDGLGVSFDKTKKKFRASISIKGTSKKIGEYKSFDEATTAYKAAKKKYVIETAKEYLDTGRISEKIAKALIERVANW